MSYSKKTNPTTTGAWQRLTAHFEEIKGGLIKAQFEKDPGRAADFSISWGDFYVDYSKNRITRKTVELLVSLAEEMSLSDSISAYFSGQPINETENRVVLHTALRSSKKKLVVDGRNTMGDIAAVRAETTAFARTVISGDQKGATGKPITDVVSIGIGGSHLGPEMVVEALAAYRNHLGIHFVSNIDGDHIHRTLQHLDPETTLFLVVSKSFGTEETLTNARFARTWLTDKLGEEAVSAHFVGITSHTQKAAAFGLSKTFPMWDWVGGRFSLWSAAGMAAQLTVGPDNFSKMLSGAEAMDGHFGKTPFSENIPVVLGLLDIWYTNFYRAGTCAVVPYAQSLNHFPAWLQQVEMESNGKTTDRSGQPVDYPTQGIVWGATGTDAQHSFFQLLHQGTYLIPVEFIGFKEPQYGHRAHHDRLMAHFFAQAQALMSGEDAAEPHKNFPGNRPSTTILAEKLTPQSLGALLALYEHKVFVKGVIWNINPFDQFGVELGKRTSGDIHARLSNPSPAGGSGGQDPSTEILLKKYTKR